MVGCEVVHEYFVLKGRVAMAAPVTPTYGAGPVVQSLFGLDILLLNLEYLCDFLSSFGLVCTH